MALPLEKILEGKYEIIEKLAEGGVGSLYKVRHRLLEEIRVIKVLRPQIQAREDAQKRFLEEAKTAIKLRHPGIAQIFDFSVAEDGMAYIVMEYIDGVALDRALAVSGPPSLAMTVMIAEQTLTAVDYLHQNHFVHRDIAPDNVMLTRDHEGNPQAKLIDLGIAKNLSGGAELTAVGTFLGKVRYCSPEHFSGQEGTSELDQRSDIYSFGVMLYELLTGMAPIAGDDFTEIAGGHLFKPPIEFAESDPDGRVPEGLRAAVLCALEKDPDKRFATATEFAESISEFGSSSANLEEELEWTLANTLAETPEGRPYSEAGTTQGRIDQHFAPLETPDRTVVHKVESKPKPKKKAKAPAAAGVSRPADKKQPSREKPRRARSVVLLVTAAVVVFVALGALWFAMDARSKGEVGRPVAVADMAPRPSDSLAESLEFPVEAPEAEGDPTSPGEPKVTVPTATPPPGDATLAAAVAEPTTDGEVTGPVGEPQSEPPARRPPPPPPHRIRPGEMIRPGPATVPPRLLKELTPRAPRAARKADQKGIVVLEVLVDENGKVVESRVKSVSPPDFGFEEVATKAARKAKYEPPSLHGIKGKMWTELRIEFSP